MHLTKTRQGYFIPSSNEDHEAVKKIAIGSEVKATQARNPKFHRKLMALFQLGFQNQDIVTQFENYRKIKTMEAGYYDRIPDKYGKVHELPRSLAFDAMSQETFEKCFNDILEVISRDLHTAPEIIKNEIDGFY